MPVHLHSTSRNTHRQFPFFVFLILAALSALPALPARASDFATQMLNATYKLFNKDSTATGFFVRDPAASSRQARTNLILVTAGHVFSRMSGDSAVVVLRHPKDDGTYTRDDFTIPIRRGDRPLWTTHPEQDVAVMRVKLPADSGVEPLPLDALATETSFQQSHLHIASPMFVLGFPTRFEANGAGFPVARHASVASFPLTPIQLQKTFLADFTTFSGDSGGPVFLPDPRSGKDPEQSPPLVVGIVLAQFRHDEKIDTLYEERVIHYPLALSTILHAQFIRETIAKLK